MRRQPVQHFQAPPDEICADRCSKRDLDQLYDQLSLRHRVTVAGPAGLAKAARSVFGLARAAARRPFGGAAAAWPIIAPAQQAAMPIVGIVSSRSPENAARLGAAFR
jgi:hypothetical protein